MGIIERKGWVFNCGVQPGAGSDLHGPALHLKAKVKNTNRLSESFYTAINGRFSSNKQAVECFLRVSDSLNTNFGLA